MPNLSGPTARGCKSTLRSCSLTFRMKTLTTTSRSVWYLQPGAACERSFELVLSFLGRTTRGGSCSLFKGCVGGRKEKERVGLTSMRTRVHAGSHAWLDLYSRRWLQRAMQRQKRLPEQMLGKEIEAFVSERSKGARVQKEWADSMKGWESDDDAVVVRCRRCSWVRGI